MFISRPILALGFYGLNFMALSSGQFSVTITTDFNYDTNIFNPRFLCENVVLQSSTSNSTVKVRIDSNLANPSLGCLGGNYSPWSCVPSRTIVSYLDFCKWSNYKILPEASILYSQVELNQAPSIQKTSFNISFINSTTTIGRQFNVIFNLTDLTKWWPIMGNYGGGATSKGLLNQRDCNPGQHIQLFTHKEQLNWGNQVLERMNFQCSDGGQYYANPAYESAGFGNDIAVNCTNTFGINGMTAYIGSSGSPIGGRFYCGVDYKTSDFGSTQAPKNRTYYCKPGSLVTGTQVYQGTVIDGIGLACSPINLTVALVNVNLSSNGTLLYLTPANFQISKNVGNINYLKLNITFPNIPPSSYKIRINNEIASIILYSDIVAYGAVIIFDLAIPQGELTLSVGFDTGLQYSVVATTNLLVFTTVSSATHTTVTSNIVYTTSSGEVQSISTFELPTSSEFSKTGDAIANTITKSTMSLTSSAIASWSISSHLSLEQEGSSSLFIVFVALISVSLALGTGVLFCYMTRSKKTGFHGNSSEFKITNCSSVNLVPIKNSNGPFYQQAPLNHIQMMNSPMSYLGTPSAISNTFSTATTLQSTASVTSAPLYLPGYNILKLGTDLTLPKSSEKLGKGGTASIYAGTLINPKLVEKHGFNTVAIKVFPLTSGQDESFRYEVAIMNLIPLNPNTVRFVGYMEAPQPAIVMKQYEDSLYNLIQNGNIEPDLAFKAARDIATGLQLIHSMNILHLDVKPHNMLWERLSDGSLNFCICDFGFASLVGDSRDIVSGLRIPKTVGVSVRYTAPEVFVFLSSVDHNRRLDSELSKKIDVYSYGISMYEMLLGSLFWKELTFEVIVQKITAGERPSISSIPSIMQEHPRSRLLIEIVKMCWSQFAWTRPTFAKICEILVNH